MRKYDTINFLEDASFKIKLLKIIFSLLILFSIVIITISVVKNKEDQKIDINQTIESELNQNTEGITEKETYVKIKDIKVAYKVIGKENINMLLTEDNNIEIEGICEDLNILEKLKIQSGSKDFSIESIIKKDNNYIFKIKYNLGV